MKLKKLLFTIALLLIAGSAWGATYNIGSGQTYTTFTLLVATETLADGDIVDGGGGTFRETWTVDGSGSSGSLITLHNATITGCALDATGVGWSLVGGEYEKTYTTEPLLIIGDGVRLVEGTNGSLAAGEWDWAANVLYLKSNPTSYTTLEVAQRSYGIDVDGKQYIDMTNLTVYGVNGNGVYIHATAPNNKVRECTIYFAHNVGVYLSGTDGSNWTENCTVDKNTMHSNGDWAGALGGDIGPADFSRKITITNNLLYGDGVAWGNDAIVFNYSAAANSGAGHVIRGNTSHGHGENFVDFKNHTDSGSDGDTVVSGNESYGEDASCILVQNGSDAIEINGDHYHDSKYGILIQEADTGPIKILNSKFVSLEQYGVNQTAGDGGSTLVNNVFYYCGEVGTGTSDGSFVTAVDGWTVVNNIVYKNGKGRDDDGSNTWAFRFADAGLNHTVDNNCIYPYEGDAAEYDYLWGVGVAYTSAELCSNATQGCSDVNEDPQFRNTAKASTYGLQLRGSSPCINAGTSGGSIPETDIEGKDWIGNNEMGCHRWSYVESPLSDDDD